jgi:Bifunctional DNA primase/polymerase, N-terminal
MSAPAAGLPETGRRAGDRVGPGLLAAALACAGRGWHVFPLRPGSKRPALHGTGRCPRTGPCRDTHQGWEQRATTDPARIHACWTHSPRCNPAIACGPSGLVVIDLDSPNGTTPPPAEWAGPGICDGAGMLARLCHRHGQRWPLATFTVATPGGIHLYFTAPAGSRLRNTTGRLGWCIDTRAAGGYVVAPGSIVAGRSYVIVSAIPPAPLPGWLAMRLAEPVMSSAGTPLPVYGIADAVQYGQAALDRETRRVAQARRGRRNDTLNRAAFALGQLTAAGLLPAALAYTKLFEAAVQAGLDHDPGCGPRGIDRTIRSGLTAGARKPRSSAA